MSADEGGDPHLLCEAADKERLENRNADDQLEYITYLVDRGVTELRESHIQELYEQCIRDIYPCGGKYRTALHRVYIQNSAHVMPEAAAVPGMVRDAVEWINANRKTRSALERAAFALWRMNWIHPFAGGNGRTSRAVSYFIVCAENGAMLPGSSAMPDLICGRREEYLAALQAVDAAQRAADDPDFSAMKNFLQDILTRQLASAIDRLSNPAPAEH